MEAPNEVHNMEQGKAAFKEKFLEDLANSLSCSIPAVCKSYDVSPYLIDDLAAEDPDFSQTLRQWLSYNLEARDYGISDDKFEKGLRGNTKALIEYLQRYDPEQFGKLSMTVGGSIRQPRRR